jgi:hypothetical protein
MHTCVMIFVGREYSYRDIRKDKISLQMEIKLKVKFVCA